MYNKMLAFFRVMEIMMVFIMCSFSSGVKIIFIVNIYCFYNPRKKVKSYH